MADDKKANEANDAAAVNTSKEAAKQEEANLPTRPGPSIDPNTGRLMNASDSGKSEHGAQVVLTGDARAAARGGLHGSIIENTMARDAAVARGEAGDGMTPDGSAPDGSMQPDVRTGADNPPTGPAGQGEGKPGSRPGDELVDAAHREAEAKRKAVREDANKQAEAQMAQAANQTAPTRSPDTAREAAATESARAAAAEARKAEADRRADVASKK